MVRLKISNNNNNNNNAVFNYIRFSIYLTGN